MIQVQTAHYEESLLFSRTPFAIEEAVGQANLIFQSVDPYVLNPRTSHSHRLDNISLDFLTYSLPLQPSVDSTIIDLQVPVESTEPAARNGRDGPNLLP